MALEFTLTIDAEAMRRAAQDPELVKGPIRRFLSRIGRIVERRAKEKAPVDTGRLRASIASEAFPLQVVIGTPVIYAPMVEFGTRPHTILPVRAKALRWYKGRAKGSLVGGMAVFAARVNHPGTRAKPFMRPALEESKSDIDGELNAMAKDIEQRWGKH